jgi:hypothetical protein
MACDSPGQICSGSLPCACPAPFVPNPVGSFADQFQQQGDAIIAFSLINFAPTNVAALAYGLNLETGVEYDLADALVTQQPPGLAVAYNVDINAYTAQTPYAAVEGTIVFETICATGATAIATDVLFAEVNGITGAVAIEGGCTMSYETININVGQPCE